MSVFVPSPDQVDMLVKALLPKSLRDRRWELVWFDDYDLVSWRLCLTDGRVREETSISMCEARSQSGLVDLFIVALEKLIRQVTFPLFRIRTRGPKRLTWEKGKGAPFRKHAASRK